MATTETAAIPYASIWNRFWAQLLDLILAFSVFVFTGLTVSARYGGRTQGGFNLEGWPALLAIALTVLPMLTYFVLAEWLFGATLGKVTAGIRVQRIAGGKLGLGAALIRNALRAIDIVPFYIFGALLVMVTERKQRLGDVAAGSVVVRRETSRAARIIALVVLLLVAAAAFVGGVRLGGPSPSGPRAGVASLASHAGDSLPRVSPPEEPMQLLGLRGSPDERPWASREGEEKSHKAQEEGLPGSFDG